MGEIRFSVLSWNAHGLPWPFSRDPRGRMNRIIARIRKEAPDVILLQEMWRGSDADHLTEALHPDWTAVCARRPNGRPEGGLLSFARNSRDWKVRETPRFHPYKASAPAWKIWEGDGLGGKGILLMDVEHDGQRLAVIDTHLQAQYSNRDYADVREQQIGELRKVIEQLEPSVPVIIGGDLNTEWRELLYARLAAFGTDLTAGERGDRGTIFDLRDGKREWIDYILAAKNDTWSASGTLETIANRGRDDPYSDHDGVLCAITLTRRR